MIMEYLIQYERTEQVSEDSWRIRRESLVCHETTQIQEIIKWATDNGKIPAVIEILQVKHL